MEHFCAQYNKYNNFSGQQHSDIIGAVAGVATAVGSAVNAVGGLFKGSTEFQDHKNALYNLYMSNNITGFNTYLTSFISGVGSNLKGHIDTLRMQYGQLKNGGDATAISKYNEYLNSFVSGIASPLTPEMFGLAFIKTDAKTASNATDVKTGTVTQALDAVKNTLTGNGKDNILIIIVVVLVILAIAFMAFKAFKK